MTKLFRLWILAVLAFMATGIAPASAQVPAPPQVETQLIANVPNLAERDSVIVGLDIRMPQGWETYWRSPGDAGMAPQLDWSGSQNVQGEPAPQWPFPEVMNLDGIVTYGYHEHLLLPFVVKLAARGQPLALNLKGTLLVCSSICVPVQIAAQLALPVDGGDVEERNVNALKTALDHVPQPGTGLGVGVKAVTMDDKALTVSLQRDVAWNQPILIVEAPAPYLLGAVSTPTLSDGNRVATWQVPHSFRGETLPDGALTFSVKDASPGTPALYAELTAPPPGGATAQAAPAATAETAPQPIGDSDLVHILLFALLGGFILNFMPCVLPVLSIKLLSVLQHAGAPQRAIRMSFLVTAAGILVSFLLLAALIIGVRSAGMAFGWGSQFQQPLFLTFLAFVVTVFAGNLWGFFEINLHHEVHGRLGSTLYEKEGHAGEFLSGMLATLLATPCSAPFVGTALSFALSRGTSEIVMIFLALGVGLALPYLLVAAAPGIVRALPKPGAWFITLRRFLAALLLLTAVWLLWVIARQSGLGAALLEGGLLAILWGMMARRRRPLVAAIVIGVILLVLNLLPQMAVKEDTAASAVGEGIWQPLDEARIAQEVAAGHTVFVDVTATWCLTCHANELFVLSKEDVQAALSNPGVVALRGDWTKQDPVITAYLEKHGRYGIPFNIVYGPGAPDGIVLPEVLTKATVLEALAKAGGGQ